MITLRELIVILERLERLAALIPPPHLHRHYRGVLAPNSPLRPQLTALARQPPAPMPNAAHPARSSARYPWAVLLARI